MINLYWQITFALAFAGGICTVYWFYLEQRAYKREKTFKSSGDNDNYGSQNI